MKDRTKFTDAQRCRIASEVYAEVLSNTDAYESIVGRDLAYLLGSIVRNTGIGYRAEAPFLAKLAPLGTGHPVWRFIDIVTKDT